MKLTELIFRLQELLESEGELEVGYDDVREEYPIPVLWDAPDGTRWVLL
jgi:hypothetical protein